MKLEILAKLKKIKDSNLLIDEKLEEKKEDQEKTFTREEFSKKYDVNELTASELLRKAGAKVQVCKFNKNRRVFKISLGELKELEEYINSSYFRKLQEIGKISHLKRKKSQKK